MTSAAVGFQCPDCLAAGQAAVRKPRTRFGGQIAEGAVVTKTLIGINVAAFILQYLIGFNASIERFSLLGYALNAQGEAIGVAAGQYYRIVTATFMHGSIVHILFNMYVLYLFGPSLEQALGRARFITLYVLSAVGGSVVSLTFSASNTPSVGASGAIFGLMGATLVVRAAMREEVTSVLVFIGINLAFGFVVPSIDWRAHVGGLIVGSVVAALFAYGPVLVQRDRSRATRGGLTPGGAVVSHQPAAQVVVFSGIAVVIVIMVALVMYRVQQLRGF
ncbi:unannotated protein [freshwater metagenome]|uniref:Unannotated protein n=1 Tax=freshwater metagenome TaxID=449393 RepID=A0A6J7E2J6_9ZZZZ